MGNSFRVMPVRAWLDEGGQLAAGTDSPTSGINDPLWSIWGLVTRGTRDVGIQGQEYAIDQYTAFELYTAAGARLSGESQRRGTLLPNKLADLVAFSADPITCWRKSYKPLYTPVLSPSMELQKWSHFKESRSNPQGAMTRPRISSLFLVVL